jgi:di/tricarboxylate transporter
MTFESWLMLIILIVMFGLLIWNKLPAWLVFMGTLTVCMTLNLAPIDGLLKGFSNSGVATVGVLFVIAAGMYSTGAITIIADKLIGLPETLRSAQLRIQPPVAVGSAFLNNTPLVAMMIPVVRDISQTARLAASRILMPLSFASILGGASTLIGTSTNLIIAGLVADALAAGTLENMDPISIFTPTPVGLPAAVVGIAFVIIFGARWLRRPHDEDVEDVGKRLYRAEFIVEDRPALVGKTVADAGLLQAEGYQLVNLVSKNDVEEIPESESEPKPGLVRRYIKWPKWWGRKKEEEPEPEEEIDPLATRVLQPGDMLTFTVDIEGMPSLWTKIGLLPAISPVSMETERHDNRLVEVVVAPQHPAVGLLVSEIPIQEDPRYRASLVAVSRNGTPMDEPLFNVRIQAGDNAILEVEDDFFYETRNQNEFSLTRRLRGYQVQRTDRSVIATVITVAMILLAAFNVMSMLNAALLGALAMLMTGCLPISRAWRSVEWSTLVVLAAAVGLESAVTATGLSQVIADVLYTLGGGNPYISLAVIFVGCIIMTNVITNAAAAAFMFPVALSMANELNVSFLPFAVILMLGTSYAFINPAGYQTNLMVQTPGKYTFMDFVKVGLPLTIIVGIIAVALAPIVYEF